MVWVKFSRRIPCTHNDVKFFCRKGHRRTVLQGITTIIIIITSWDLIDLFQPSLIASSKLPSSIWSVIHHYVWHHVVHSCYMS